MIAEFVTCAGSLKGGKCRVHIYKLEGGGHVRPPSKTPRIRQPRVQRHSWKGRLGAIWTALAVDK